MKTTTKIKIGLTVVILAADFLLLPWLLTYPVCVKQYGIGPAASELLKINPLSCIGKLFTDHSFRRIWLYLQLAVFACIIGFAWNPYVIKKKDNKLGDFGGPPAAGNGQHGTADWQTEKEIDEATTVWNTDETPKKGGVVLGVSGDKGKELKVNLDTGDTHNLNIGTTRSGKSRRVFIPTIWEIGKTGESMIITDPKGELYKKTHKYLENMGYEIVLLDFRYPTRGNRWNPMDMVVQAVKAGDIAAASEAAWDIAHTIVHQDSGSSEGKVWQNGEESTIAALILSVAMEAPYENQKHFASVFNVLAALGEYDEEAGIPLNAYFKSLPTTHIAKIAFAPAAVAPYRQRGSFFANAATDLRLWADPKIADMTSGQDHELDASGKRKTATFLVIPDEKSTRNILATLYIDQTYQALVNLAVKNNNRLPNRVHYLLDEFGNLPPIRDFAKKITVAGGRGMKFLIAVQALQQIESVYKKDYKTITGNCHTWLYILTTDLDTAEELSKRTGSYTVQSENQSSSVNERNYTSGYSVGLTGRRLLTADEILKIPEDRAILFQARNNPSKMFLPDLSYWPCESELISSDDLQERPLMQVPIWIPEIPIAEEEKEGENTKKPKKKVKLKKDNTEGSGEDDTTSEYAESEAESEHSFMDEI